MIPQREKKEHMLYNKIPVLIEKSPEYDIETVINKIEKNIPSSLATDLDYVVISDMEHLNDRDLDSVFVDGVIYMSPKIEDTEEATLTVAHEIAHSVEKLYPQIYADETIESEFLKKRLKLRSILSSHGIETGDYDFLSTEYEENFDDFLYLIVGYPRLRTLTAGLFMSPYAITSVREYFADAFEEYFFRDPSSVRRASPAVYYKMEDLLNTLGETHA